MQYLITNPSKQDLPQIIKMLDELACQEKMQNQLTQAKLWQAMQNNHPKIEVLIAKSDEAIIGCVLFYMGFDVLSASHGGHLSDIFVSKQYRKVGVGTSLIAGAAKTIMANGGVWLSWTVDKNNAAAKQFYHNLGAITVDADFMALGESSLKLMLG
jgi:ribosomal protein S18 acetylase RimI-like enzyme